MEQEMKKGRRRVSAHPVHPNQVINAADSSRCSKKDPPQSRCLRGFLRKGRRDMPKRNMNTYPKRIVNGCLAKR